MSGQFLSMDIERCRASGHQFIIAGSDKTPMKRNLICRTCTDRHIGFTVYVAYGIDTESWGEWRTLLARPAEPIHEMEVEQ